MGAAAAFSFYPGKNLGACGEAGAVTTNNGEVAEKIRMLRDHGQRQKYSHDIEGYNGRLDAVQAGILSTKLKHLPRWNRQRRVNARRYEGLFRSCANAITPPFTSPKAKSVYHLYVIRSNHRDRLQAQLALAGISTQIHYPSPLHLHQAYRSLGYKEGDFPVAEKVAREILSLPMYPQLTAQQQEIIVEEIFDSCEGMPRVDAVAPALQLSAL
jgi:dTDP-4-amino-4,6-dideoxygalactose transaminase